MRKILITIFVLAICKTTFSQGINFQGVARSSNGTIIASSNVGLRLSIISKSVDATPEYIETKTVVTNAQGIFSIVVGDATNTAVVGNFKNIAWSDGPKFLKVEMDPSGGTNYLNMGATQLQYVPYAFYSLGVDGANVKGMVPVKAGGTGVASLEELKSVLKIPSIIDTSNLSNRIDEIIKTKDIIQNDIVINGVNAGIGGGKSNSNTIFGFGSLLKNTKGQDNTAIGSYALSENVTGYNNTAVGGGALGSNISGYLNTAIGRFALGSITSGNRNTSIGNGTLGLISDGVANTAIGFSALSKQTSFGPNDAFGSESQSNLTT